ncbi:VOC family protein [Stackebrandtia nassauensis]|uniref:Glyoxalase-like domain-containing protein n=1 Tax=Stackebrandtia nassauensis (strain DSM 44728 / CIP 108903 / NRRL B-16338 / NBRC 102104 / LLR-40K-21) TaxID=446470 RepID=D3PU13_STANL|nr:VOC family protein [Stackebrandtia nassauensis]ADD40959.1 hypothetical protein Snas_1249 [Stackebrandtia nassauensis DSM 44728]
MVRWLRACAGRPETRWETTVDFWSRVTGTLPEWRSPGDVWLEPVSGDGMLALTNRAAAAATRVDLVVDDAEAVVRRAFELGATASNDDGEHVTGRSPGGLTFHIAAAPDSELAEPPVLEHPNGSLSGLDQICVDIGPSDWDTELAFWSDLTGHKARTGARPEYAWIKGPNGRTSRLLLQRLDEDRPTSAHLDFACSDVAAVCEAHVAAGARSGDVFPWWTVMYDPSGAVYCLTARDPVTGALP